MSWENRPYAHDNEPQFGGDGLRSWFGGMPAPGKAVKWIAIANIGLFVICMISGGSQGLIFRALEMRTDLVWKGQIWRLFTFTYLHSQHDLLHILFNMIGLYFLGMSLERHLGSKRFFYFYTAAGFIAVAAYFLITSLSWLDPEIPIVGASGGVLGILGACAVLFPSMRIILVLFPVPIRMAALIFGILYVFNLGTRGMNAGGDACHLAGLAFGIAYGYCGAHWSRWFSDWREASQQRGMETRRQRARDLELNVDRILDKVHQHGIGSLTAHEKRILEGASKQGRR